MITYGGLLWGILPLRNHVSFESHVFGLIAGILVVWLEHKFGERRTPG
ncbi:MAG: rhomboid family intramembrane serine protease [Gammaproteobacteria bacterium]